MHRITNVNESSRSSRKLHDIACSLTLGIVLATTTLASLLTVGVRQIDFLAKTPYLPLVSIGIFLAIGVLVTLGCYLALRNKERIISWADRKREGVSSLSFDRNGMLFASAVIFVCWIPWIIIQYPCAMNGDTYNQLYQFQTSSPTYYSTLSTTVSESFIDHHPVFDTLLFGAFLTFGDMLGSQNVGLFVYSLFQCALSALALGITCCYLERLKVPWLFRAISLAFCALFPPIPLWATCMVKDSINACVLIFFCLITTEVVRSHGGALSSKRLLAVYILVAILCIATKKTGAIVVTVTGIALAILYRERWRALLLETAVPLIVCFVLVPAFVYPAIGGVAPGGKQEIFGFALQQMITAINENDDLNASERERLEAMLNVKRALKRYQPDLVDYVKNSVHADATTQDYLALIPTYLAVGIRHPRAYTASVLNIAGPLIVPGRTLTFYTTPKQGEERLTRFEKADVNGELHLTFYKPEPIASVADAVQSWWRSFIPKLGPLRVFFDSGFYGGWIPLTCLVLCLFHKRRWTAALAPMLSVMIIILVGPTASIRYILPLLFTTPLMLGIACSSLREGEHPLHVARSITLDSQHERKSEPFAQA